MKLKEVKAFPAPWLSNSPNTFQLEFMFTHQNKTWGFSVTLVENDNPLTIARKINSMKLEAEIFFRGGGSKCFQLK